MVDNQKDQIADMLELKDIRKVYNQDLLSPRKVAIAQLSCRFPRGITGFMGHNGAGKTTSIKIIFGLIKADKGAVLFKGRPLRSKDRNEIGYMPETNKLAITLTPYETLDYQLRVAGRETLSRAQRVQRVQEKLEEVH